MRAGDCARQSLIASPLFLSVRIWQLGKPLPLLAKEATKKYSPIPPEVGMDTVRLRLPYAALQGIYAKPSAFVYLLLYVLDTP